MQLPKWAKSSKDTASNISTGAFVLSYWPFFVSFVVGTVFWLRDHWEWGLFVALVLWALLTIARGQLLEHRQHKAQPSRIDKKILVIEVRSLANAISDFTADAQANAPVWSPTLVAEGSDHLREWQDEQRKRMEYDNQTKARFDQRFRVPLAAVLSDLTALDVVTEEDRSALWWAENSADRLNGVASMLSRLARKVENLP